MKLKKRNLLVYLIVVLMLSQVLVLGGCGQDNPGTSKESTENVATERTIVDMAGRSVTIPGEIDSVATFGSVGVINTFVELFGEGDKILNQMPERFTKNDKWKYQYEFAPQIADGPILEDADGIQIEAVLEANPDVCIVMTKENATLLEEKGIAAVYLEWFDLDDVDKAINILGEVFDKKDVAEDYLEYFDEKVEYAQELTGDIADTDKKKVLYGNITQYTQPHIIAEWWIEAAGGISVTNNDRDNDSYEYTIEDVLAWNPDVMFTTDTKMGDEIEAEARLKDISAVENDQIYYIPTVAHVWGNRTVEQPLTIMWTINKLYPEIMTDDMLADEIEYFYDHFFKTKLNEEQIKEIIG